MYRGQSWRPDHSAALTFLMHIPYDQLDNIYRLAPEIVLCATGILIMLIDPFTSPARKRWMGWLGFVGTLGALAALGLSARHAGAAYSGLVVVDGFSPVSYTHLDVYKRQGQGAYP